MNYVAMALNSRDMSIMKIKKIMSSGLDNDKHCYLALEQLFKELPYDKMNSLKNEFGLQELSMGMSSDYIEAVEFGSTFVRIGTKIFGKRN